MSQRPGEANSPGPLRETANEGGINGIEVVGLEWVVDLSGQAERRRIDIDDFGSVDIGKTGLGDPVPETGHDYDQRAPILKYEIHLRLTETFGSVRELLLHVWISIFLCDGLGFLLESLL